jgi:hypothetical protein
MEKYSDKFINSHNILKYAIIGLEFEFFMKDLSFFKTLEILNQYLSPIKVHGFRQYHSDFKPDHENFKIEPDLSLGQSGCELITGPMNYHDAKFYLVKILKFIQEYGYTTDKASIHYNLSFTEECDKDLNDLNILKLILQTDEDEIYRIYPSRKANVYSKSIKKMIPYKEYDFNNVPIDVVKNNLRLPNDKYYGINFLHINKNRDEQRLEFRYIGGKDYENNIGQIIYFLDKFIINVYNSIDTGFTNEDIDALENYLEENITNFKTFSKYDSFIVDFPSISLQIDQNNSYDIINAYYPKIYSKLFNLIDSTQDLKDCIINYVTTFQRMEVIDAKVKSNFNLKDYDFINCRLYDGIFDSCVFLNSEITSSQIIKSKIHGTNVVGSKVLNSTVEASMLKDCFFMGGYLNSEMEGGVFRSGKLGPYANISSDTKIISDTDNFFNTSFEDDDYQKGKDQGVIKSFKK